MILFAYTKEPAARIVRFELDAQVQIDLAVYLQGQINNFNAGCEEIAFDGNYKPDSDECLYIPEFDDIDSLAEAVADPRRFPSVSEDEGLLESIKALFFGVEENGEWVVYLQAFDRRRLITTRGFSIFHSENVYKKLDGTGITIDNRVVAKLAGKRLSFRSFFYARQIFDLSSYYQDATDTDIAEFAQLDKVSVRNVDQLKQISDTWVRRRLWLVQQSKILEIGRAHV